jgi:hypothetical protein
MKSLHLGSKVCPRCYSSETRPSKRSLIEYLFSLVFLKPYRCRVCNYRFWRPG